MADYCHVFGEKVASGLGLARPSLPDSSEVLASYREDPAAAFSHMAELLQPSGGAIPTPFAAVVPLTPDSSPPITPRSNHATDRS